MLGAIAQFETEIRAERQMEGIRKAQARGVQFGRKKKLTDEQVKELQQKRREGMLIKDLMQAYDLSKASIYRYLEQPQQPAKKARAKPPTREGPPTPGQLEAPYTP